MLFAGVSGGCATAGSTGSTRGTHLSPSGSRAKLEFRAERTSDFERKKGVGGVLGRFWEVVAVEGAVVVHLDERCEFYERLMVIWIGRQVWYTCMPLVSGFAIFHMIATAAVWHLLC